MELTDYTINEITPYVTGDNKVSVYRKGKDLTLLFGKYGCRDIYEFQNGGLPKLSPKDDRNPSRSQYVKNRLKKLNGSHELKLLLEEVINNSNDTKKCANDINHIISNDKFRVEKIEGKFFILGDRIIKKLEIKNDAKFIDIQNKILSELERAQVSISIAMAWFTNDILLSKLKEKQRQGIKVEIVIYDDGINTKHGVDLSNFDTVKIKGSRGGIMHNKFCIIDNQIVLSGSYNWSNNAEYKNDESIEISEDGKLATQFSVRFRELRNKVKI